MSPVQTQVIAALVAGKSITAAAREAGVHRSTIYQWRREHPEFQLVLDQARSHHQAALFDFVQDLANQALEAVETALTSDEPELRLRAAQIILRVASPAG